MNNNTELSIEIVQTSEGSPLEYGEFGPYELANLQGDSPMDDVHQKFDSFEEFSEAIGLTDEWIIHPLVVTEDPTGKTSIEIKEPSSDNLACANAILYAEKDNPHMKYYPDEYLVTALRDYEYWMNGNAWEMDLYADEECVATVAGFYGSEKEAVERMIQELDRFKDLSEYRDMLADGIYCTSKTIS